MVRVNFEDEAEADLQTLADRERKTIPQTLEDAIAVKLWIEDARRAGKKIFIQDKDGKLQEVEVK
jgi:predicted transcriptional regulator